MVKKENYLVRELEAVGRDVERNLRYHAKRAHFFDMSYKAINFAIIILGSGAIANASFSANYPFYFGLTVSALGGLAFVSNFGEKKAQHEAQFSRFSKLNTEISQTLLSNEITEHNVVVANATLTDILANETTGYYKALNAICHNEVMTVHGQKELKVKVPALIKLSSHLIRYSNYDFRPIKSWES